VAPSGPADAETALRGDAVVIVPGLLTPKASMILFRRGFEAVGCRAHLFGYPSWRRPLAANVERLEAFARAAAGERVHFIGHSLGGVLILQMLERHRFARPGRVVCIGSPLTGSRAGARLARSRAGRWVLGESARDLVERRGLGAWRGAPEVGVIAGNVPLGVGRAITGLAGPNDGTVAVAETRLPGIADHIVLPCSHFSLLWSRAALRQSLWFIVEGAFRRRADGRPLL
jgi:pimeloyl-ACP methyl ester carboxylesterase